MAEYIRDETFFEKISQKIQWLEEELSLRQQRIDSLESEVDRLHGLAGGEKNQQQGEYSGKSDEDVSRQLGDEFWIQAFDAIDDIVTIHNKDLSMIRANKAANEQLLAGSEVAGKKHCYEIFTGETAPCSNCLLINAEKNEGKHSSIIINKKLNKVFQVSSSLIYAKHHSKEYLIHVAKDVSESIDLNIEKIIHESDERFAKAFDSNPAPMVISTIDTGRFVDVNQRWIQMLGYTREELLGKTSYDIGIWQDSSDRDTLIETLLRDKSVQEHEIVVKTRSGKLRTTLWSAEIISISGREMMLSLITDITEQQQTERALKESTERFELAFDASPDSININRLSDGLYVNINKGFTELTGFAKEDVNGKTSLDINIWHRPSDRQAFVSILVKEGYCENFEAQFRRKDGSVTVALISGRVISLDNESHIISMTRDISKVRKIEEETVRQKMLFKAMFEAIYDGVVITDTSRHILMANKGMEKIFGYTPEELAGRSTYHLYAKQDNYHAAGIEGHNDFQQKDERHYIADYRDKSGSEFPGETLGVKLYDSNKSWIGNLGIIRDVSTRHKKEIEMGRLVAAIEQTNDAIVITDEAGSIQYVNAAFEKVSGYSRKDALGQNPRILKSGEHQDDFYSELWQTLSENKTYKGRIINRKKDGSLFTEEATISPICDSLGKVVNYVAVKRDITAQLLLEAQYQQAQKMEAVGRLTGGVAHDFNNILTIINGYAEQSLDGLDASHRLHGPLTAILDAGNRSAKIIRQLLAFSRKQTISPQIIDLNQAVSGMLSMIHRLIGENITVSWVPETKPLHIKIDPAQIDQVLANLCVNTRDAIEGTGQLSIDTTKVYFDKDFCRNHIGFLEGDFVQMTVSDDGCGIEKSLQEKVFEPFFTTKTLEHGTGLGLATVYGIMKQNNGFVNLYSEVGIGTTIKLYFPLCCEEVIPTESKSIRLEKTNKKITVLLVEDDLTLMEMAESILLELGYKVLAANSPKDAISIVKEQKQEIQLLLTDVIMPDMNGMELADYLHSLLPDLKVIFMSGYTANVIAHDCIVEENINFLQKPYSIKELANTLETVLNG